MTSELEQEHELTLKWIQQHKELARQLIRRDVWPDDQTKQEIICDEYEHQREVVTKFGQCEGGCHDRNLRKHEFGHLVCRWTHQPCPRTELGELIEFFSILNGSDDHE